VVWDLLRKRHDDDLKRLISAYRGFLKAAHQTESEGLGGEGSEWRKLKGGFGKAFHILYSQWPTPNESQRFERTLVRWLKKELATDRAFIQAFNDYLKQKRLNPEELNEVIQAGEQTYQG
jgi:hypothetical protein